MNTRSLLSVAMVIALMGGTLWLTGCENGNLFGGLHDRGESGDTTALLNDADQALNEGNYRESLSIYNRVLAQDPNNSQALYGSAAALLGTSGLNIGVLITNVLKQAPGTASINSIADLIADSRITFSASATTDADSILNGIDLESLDGVIDAIICRLQKIVSGATDGKISANNVDVLVNLATLCIIRAALKPIRAGYLDITNIGGSYQVVNKVSDAAAFCNDAANKPMIITMAKDVAAAYALFNRAVSVLGLSNDQIITRLRNDVDSVMTILLDAGKSWNSGTTCRDKITDPAPNGAGLDSLTTFRSYTEIFNPPTGC